MLFEDNYITLAISSKVEIVDLFRLKLSRLIWRDSRSEI